MARKKENDWLEFGKERGQMTACHELDKGMKSCHRAFDLNATIVPFDHSPSNHFWFGYKNLPLHFNPHYSIQHKSVQYTVRTMNMPTSLSLKALFLLLSVLAISTTISARLATFNQDFRITWADTHIKQMQGGSGIQLILDQNSGCGFASKNKYLFGRVSMKIKLVPGDSAGTVTAFYMNSDTDTRRDELDFEFLGNRTGQPYTVQTNVYAHGKGDREQRVNLWFDPAANFHTYSILWTHRHVVFSVDAVPIRVYKNNEAKGIPYPKFQPMGIYSTLWEADDWATRGGLEKIDWSKAPFYAYYKDFEIEGCPVPGPATCASNLRNWWEAPAYQQLTPIQARNYRWVRINHMTYDYCTDKSRYPTTPPECMSGI